VHFEVVSSCRGLASMACSSVHVELRSCLLSYHAKFNSVFNVCMRMQALLPPELWQHGDPGTAVRSLFVAVFCVSASTFGSLFSRLHISAITSMMGDCKHVHSSSMLLPPLVQTASCCALAYAQPSAHMVLQLRRATRTL
jgi:hypothetical protein